MTPEKEEFIKRLIDICELLKYPERGRQTQLANRYKLKQPSVRKWFTGEAMPAYEIASDLCKRALVNYEWLMTGRMPKYFSADLTTDPILRHGFELLAGMDPSELPKVIRGVELLTAMEPGERPTAIRVLDSLVEPPAANGTTDKPGH